MCGRLPVVIACVFFLSSYLCSVNRQLFCPSNMKTTTWALEQVNCKGSVTCNRWADIVFTFLSGTFGSVNHLIRTTKKSKEANTTPTWTWKMPLAFKNGQITYYKTRQENSHSTMRAVATCETVWLMIDEWWYNVMIYTILNGLCSVIWLNKWKKLEQPVLLTICEQ